MFSNHLEEYAQNTLKKRMHLLGAVGEEIVKKIEEQEKEKRVLLNFLYGTMPIRDIGEYSFSLFLEFVNHALMLRQTIEWCKRLPEDLFLHYVLYHRINSENIVSCRPFFYHQIIERIKGKDIEEAVLEVNYWCAQNASYEASDNRTASPITVYKSGKGRCGEESTFTVTALRSVGIPARQVYTPRWAHCDDNHAWVEVFIEGTWKFLGACEPEEVLNKGWFLGASSRALLIHGRTFGNYFKDTLEEEIGKEDLLHYMNNTSLYAKTKYLAIKVVDRNGKPLEGAKVIVQILNMAEFSAGATLLTNQDGTTGLTIGLGDIFVRGIKGNYFNEVLISVEEQDEVVLQLANQETDLQWRTDVWEEFEVHAPLDYPMHKVILTKEQKEINRIKLKNANRIREERIQSYYVPDCAQEGTKDAEILKASKGNFDEIYKFLQGSNHNMRMALLESLTIKDYKDAKADVLEEHLEYAAAFAGEDGFEEWILCPRIYLEELTCYRAYIQEFFTESQKNSFVKDPFNIWNYIKTTISYNSEEDYAALYSTPTGCLKLKQGNPLSQRILFVAICRTLGIPARLNKVTLEAEWKQGDVILPVETEASSKSCLKGNRGTLRLLVENGELWNYYQTWTIGKWEENQFRTLDFDKIRFSDNCLNLELEGGMYRLITTSRTPSGNQYAAKRCFVLEGGMEEEIHLSLHQSKLEDLLVNNEIGDFDLENSVHEKYAVRKIVEGRTNILAFLEEGAEPTEHVLNEMLECQEELRNTSAQILFIVKEEESLQNPTIAKTLQAIPNIQVYYDDFSENVELIARRMYVDPEKLPLLLVTKEGMNGIYACSGYNVGSIGLIRGMI